MHPLNRYKSGYNFAALVKTLPELKAHIVLRPDGSETLNFSSPIAVRLLNKALLLHDYKLEFWDLAEEALCPAVPGRLNYIHALFELLGRPKNKSIHGIDIGTGASLIYPILGIREYGWKFVATDINPASIRAAESIVSFNKHLKGKVDMRKQLSPKQVLRGVLRKEERFDFSMCNPPFYETMKAAEEATTRKWKNLAKGASTKRNFSGSGAELWCPGGELAFLKTMISESAQLKKQVRWFTSLVSQERNLKPLQQSLRRLKALRVELLPLDTANKKQRVLAWSWEK